jgi:adenosine kinase
LGGQARVMATCGDDAAPYLKRLDDLNISRTHVKQVSGAFTGQAFIMTDLDDNQITAFHPGAMGQSHTNHVADCKDATLGIVAPDGRDGMLQHAQEFAEAGIPFIFDPGQGMPMFSGDELLTFIKKASYVAVNDYEAKLMEEKTGQTMESIAQGVKAVIVTLGGEGALIFAGGKRHTIPCVKADKVVDPTGCGDAFRGGLLYGIENGLDWQQTGQLASLMGSLKIACRGAQNHVYTKQQIGDLYKMHFKSTIF